jgi:hypothetical protein
LDKNDVHFKNIFNTDATSMDLDSCCEGTKIIPLSKGNIYIELSVLGTVTFNLRYLITNSSVGIAIMLWAGQPRSRSSIPDRGNVQTGSEAHTPSYTMGTGGCFPGGKADNSHPSIVEVKNSRAIAPLHHMSS